MQGALSHLVGDRRTEYPAAVIREVLVRAPDGMAHSRRWQGVIDTGADLSIIPEVIVQELRLSNLVQRVRVWSYRKDEPPREIDVVYVKLGLAPGFEVLTKAIPSVRANILIGRSALLRTRLWIDWPGRYWRLENASQ